jgi:hypothetical protein
MAELIEDPKKKKASFGDAAAAATDGGVTQLNVGKPGDFPVNPDGTPMQKVAPSLGALGPSVPTTPVQAGAMSKYDQDLKNANDQAAARLARPVANPDASVAISSYLDLQQKANDLKPSYFSQSTPTSSAMLAQAQSDANNALGAVYTQGGPASKAPAPVTAGPQSPAMPGASLMENYTTRMNPDQYAARAAPSTPQIAASDSALPTTAPPIPAGAVKTQGQMNMEADLKSAEAMKAERLAAESRAPQAVVTHSGNDWQARNNLRNLEVSASSMTAQPKDLMAYEIARKHDTQLQGGSTAADVANVAAVNRHNEINSTAQVANARTAQQGQQFGASQELAKQRLALDSKTQGAQASEYGAQARLKTVQANAAEQLAALQNKYMTAKPEEQAAIAKQIQTLSNKADKVQLHTVNQPDTMAPDGMTKLGGGQRLVVQGADGSFHEVPVGGQQQAGPPVISSPDQLAKLPNGTVFIGPDGKQHRKD